MTISASHRHRSSGLVLIVLIALVYSGLIACQPAENAEGEESGGSAIALSLGRVAAEDGVAIAYTSRGAGEKTLVFVHGWMCDQTYWRHQVAAFKDDYRILTIDLPGHGESASGRAEWTLEAYGSDVARVVEHLELQDVILVGHSMGGAVILEAASRLGDSVRGLIGVETFHNAEFEVPEEAWNDLMGAYRENFPSTCGQMVRAMFPNPVKELATEVKEDMCGGPADVGVALMERFGAYKGADLMAQMKIPIRAINAEISTPTQVEINRRHAPQFDAIVQKQAGHFLMLEHPEQFNEHFRETLAAIEAGS